MRRTLTIVFVLILVLLAYAAGRFQATTTIQPQPADWAGEDTEALAWQALQTSVEDAAARVLAHTASAEDRTAGFAFLADLLSAALEMKVSNGDPAHPAFTDWMASGRRLLGDNPDATYHTAEVSSRHIYRIEGTLGEAQYIGIMAYGRGLNGWNRAGVNLSMEDLTFTDDGAFEIVASRERPEGNAHWLPLEEDTHLLMVRRYYTASQRQRPGELQISRLNPGEVRPLALQERLQRAARFVSETMRGTLALAQMMSQHPNSADAPPEYNADFGGIFYPTQDNIYLGTWYRLAPDEALVVDGDVPDALYWSASLQNAWLQSYPNPLAAIHHTQIRTHDNRYRLIVSAHDPGSANWLDTGGQREGLLAIRYLMSRDEAVRPTMRVVKTSDLASAPHALPAECRRLSAAEIEAQFADVEDRAEVQEGSGGGAVNTWHADGRFVSRWQTANSSGELTGTWWVNDRGERCVRMADVPDSGPALRCGPIYACGDAYRSVNGRGETHGIHRLKLLSSNP